MGITDYLVQIQELTNTNLKLLKALNDSLTTDKGYVSVSTDEGSFNIPSFIMLENKINTLQNNFENLVNAPITSEANFIFNGDSRAIEVKRYEQSPASLTLEEQSEFYHENNDVLKDFLTPVPYLKFELSEIPYDISTVDIRKVVALTNKIKNRFKQILDNETSKSVSWGDIYKLLADAEQDKDYVLYDTVTRLPIRKGQGNGQYVISALGDMYIDENLDQHVVVTLANNKDGYQKGLTYTVFDQTIERDLAVGDYLVSWDGHAKFQIEELNFNTNTIKLKILYGDYINLTSYDPDYETIDDTAKLRFFSNIDLFSDSNYAKVPLEEDQYIFVAIAPLNDRMNVRAAWGDGLLVNVYGLTTDEGTQFEEYYKNCRNIGDIMNEISKVMSNSVSRLSDDDINKYMAAKPELDEELIKVVHVNKHLDESTTIKNIRALYSQKNNYNASLNETQTSLTTLQDQLSSIDFQDTTGIRPKLQNQIDVLTKKKNELINSLIKISDEIALTANNSVVPIENAKYRIRGFFDFVGFAQELGIDEGNIKGINVQYRYRNNQLEVGSADTYVKDVNENGEVGDEGDRTFIFSDWNRLYTPLRPRIKTDSGYGPEEDTSNMNLPSFNQIDIPISQGESVDIRLKVIYDFGYPFIQMMSTWSDVMTIEFPVEFLKDVSIVDIIKENNNDIETNRFKTILLQDGVTTHVEDSILDQDVLFFHKPENISSGFYTSERRIIPLRDKLKDMNDVLVRLSDEVEGSAAESLGVSVDFDESTIQLSPYEIGLITLKEYSGFSGDSGQYGNYTWDKNTKDVNILCNIRLTNTSQHSLKLFSMFPASENMEIGALKTSKFDIKDYTIGSDNLQTTQNYGVYIYDPMFLTTGSGDEDGLGLQTSNQIITFRVNNPYDGKDYYATCNDGNLKTIIKTDNKLPRNYIENSIAGVGCVGMSVYPYDTQENGLMMTFKEAKNYLLMNPGDEYVFPIMIRYNLSENNKSIQKTLSFDVRTSLYNDPSNYTFRILAKYTEDSQDKLVRSLSKKYNNYTLKSKEYKPIVG